MEGRLRDLRTFTDRPLAVGFGLDDAALLEQVRTMGATPVIGSALVRALHEGQELEAFLGPRMIRL